MTERRDVIGRLIRIFPKGLLVDLGTGHGGFAKLAANLGWQVTAVDARTDRWPDNAPPGIEWVQADVREVDLAPYDLVLCLGLFYHLTVADQLDLLGRTRVPMIVDTHVDHGTHEHKLSDPVTIEGYRGRLYREPGRLTSSWGNAESFWPTLESLHAMLAATGFPTVLTVEPWLWSDRVIFVALPD